MYLHGDLVFSTAELSAIRREFEKINPGVQGIVSEIIWEAGTNERFYIVDFEHMRNGWIRTIARESQLSDQAPRKYVH